MSEQKYVQLNSGVEMPVAGIGTFLLSPDEAEASVLSALQGAYLIPDLKLSDTTEYHIGKYGRMRKRFLEENHRGIYSHMLLSETLWKHLAEIDEESNEMMDRLVRQMAKKEGVTEQLKSDDWLCWLQKMNSIQSRAEEVVLHDLIYSL